MPISEPNFDLFQLFNVYAVTYTIAITTNNYFTSVVFGELTVNDQTLRSHEELGKTSW